MSIRKTLSKLSKRLPGGYLSMMFFSFFKITDEVPEISRELWAFMKSNLKFMKKHREEYKIVSLGCDCMARSYTTTYMLKPGKAAGEKGMPFDLACSPPEAVADNLENDFADYFADGWSYDFQWKRWNNTPESGMFYPHDKDCGPDDLEKIQNRLRGRIANFREVMDYPNLIMFVLHKKADGIKEDIERICRKITELRKGKPSKFLVMACDLDETCTGIDGAELCLLPYPSAEFHWYDPKMRYTAEGIRHEMKFVKVCRDVLSKELGING
ncbi:MAG: hypothetical protein IKB74_00295 [Lentisphaeria bacterium]|nr:hypothetical protein [Lentisphaeria bacterium]